MGNIDAPLADRKVGHGGEELHRLHRHSVLGPGAAGGQSRETERDDLVVEELSFSFCSSVRFADAARISRLPGPSRHRCSERYGEP